MKISDINVSNMPGTATGPRGKDTKTDGKGFQKMLEDSLGNVNRQIIESKNMARQMAAGQPVNLADTMIAITKADLSFKLLLQVRNKALSAYEEVMRMQL